MCISLLASEDRWNQDQSRFFKILDVSAFFLIEHSFAKLKSTHQVVMTLFCVHGVNIEAPGQYTEKPNAHQNVRLMNMPLWNLYSGLADPRKTRIPQLSPRQSPEVNMDNALVKISM